MAQLGIIREFFSTLRRARAAGQPFGRLIAELASDRRAAEKLRPQISPA